MSVGTLNLGLQENQVHVAAGSELSVTFSTGQNSEATALS